MKKFLTIVIIVIIFTFSGCSDDGTGYNTQSSPVEMSMDNALGHIAGIPGTVTDNSRSLIVIISDTHLGDKRSIDNGYGWFINNRNRLVNFLNQLAVRPSVKELVLGGDLFDEWVVPMEYDTFNGFGSDQEGESKFVNSIASNNPDVINAINNLISSGVKVTYVPGNHDMLVSEDDINRLFPGINQQRDSAGLGAYSPQWLPQVVIEHGHRYDFYNAPDILSNKIPYSPQNYTDNPDAILPPGFFVTKIATSQGVSVPIPAIDNTSTGDGHFLYWASWQLILDELHVTEDPNARIIKTGIDGYRDNYAINDLAPSYNKEPLLYQNIEENWGERQNRNNINVPISIASALLSGAWDSWCDFQSYTQYFTYNSDKRIVVFGHTHHATLGYSVNNNRQKCIYANSGTWIDSGNPDCTCVVIEPDSQINGNINVSVYQFTEQQTLLTLHSGTIMK
ncbi:MAG: metallophosphoesterase [Candidatus Eremiobacterota bacterium]